MSFRLFDEIDPLQFGQKACILLVRARSDKGQKLLVLPNDKVILRDDFFEQHSDIHNAPRGSVSSYSALNERTSPVSLLATVICINGLPSSAPFPPRRPKVYFCKDAFTKGV